jgi:hypothetical protein
MRPYKIFKSLLFLSVLEHIADFVYLLKYLIDLLINFYVLARVVVLLKLSLKAKYETFFKIVKFLLKVGLYFQGIFRFIKFLKYVFFNIFNKATINSKLSKAYRPLTFHIKLFLQPRRLT